MIAWKVVSELSKVTKAVNWLDGAFCKIIESGKAASFIVGTEEEMKLVHKAFMDMLADELTDKRTIPQNDKIHCMFADMKSGVIKMIGKRVVLADYQPDELKALLVMWFANEMELMGTPLAKPPKTIIDPISGQLISIRPSTKDFGKKVMSDFVEWLYALGAESGVKWSEKALECYQEYRQAK
jgi:NinB protein